MDSLGMMLHSRVEVMDVALTCRVCRACLALPLRCTNRTQALEHSFFAKAVAKTQQGRTPSDLDVDRMLKLAAVRSCRQEVVEGSVGQEGCYGAFWQQCHDNTWQVE